MKPFDRPLPLTPSWLLLVPAKHACMRLPHTTNELGLPPSPAHVVCRRHIANVSRADRRKTPPPPCPLRYPRAHQFVKYLDSEVERLEKVEKDLLEKRKNKISPDKNDPPVGGNEVLNVIRIVRSRVCAQVDLMMGEDVAVLTRMLSYDDRFMMRAALRTGEMRRNEMDGADDPALSLEFDPLGVVGGAG